MNNVPSSLPAPKTVAIFYVPRFKDEKDLIVILIFTDLKTIDIKVTFPCERKSLQAPMKEASLKGSLGLCVPCQGYRSGNRRVKTRVLSGLGKHFRAGEMWAVDAGAAVRLQGLRCVCCSSVLAPRLPRGRFVIA